MLRLTSSSISLAVLLGYESLDALNLSNGMQAKLKVDSSCLPYRIWEPCFYVNCTLVWRLHAAVWTYGFT